MSTRQSTAKANFAAASSAFASLTQEQIESWNTYADGHPVVNALGQSVKLTGHMMFVSLNAQLLNCGEDINTEPPSDSSVFAPVVGGVLADDEPNLSVEFDAVPAESFLLVAASRPVSPAVTFQKTFRQFAVAPAAAVNSDITAAVTSAYGALVAGQKIFLKLTPVNANGVTGIPVIVPAVIAVHV